jgi:hypothetical protein
MAGDKTPHKTEQIIIEIEKYPTLYDKTLRDFKDIEKKKDIWRKIAKSVQLT